MAKKGVSYICGSCGYQAGKWLGRCPECLEWGALCERVSKPGFKGLLGGAGFLPGDGVKSDEFMEAADVRFAASAGAGAASGAGGLHYSAITDVDACQGVHVPTGFGEVDRVLGGGVVPGATILLSGEPGAGKSTLLLAMAARVAGTGQKVLYISGEESASQVRLRASRTKTLHRNLFLSCESDLQRILETLRKLRPAFTVIDSVQTVGAVNVPGALGSITQVREVARELVCYAKNNAMPLVLVGHVTKDGTVAGPRTLEHLVDVVCSLEGERDGELRILRAHKNRFGACDEIGCFKMRADGVTELDNPAQNFMGNTGNRFSGSCLTITVEGRRPIPVEIQALVASSVTAQPKRITNGIETSRLAMILAVLERRAGAKLHDQDIYVSTVGGAKLRDPAADLAIALAVISSYLDKPITKNLAAYGEISLTGEIRLAKNQNKRNSEANRLNLKTLTVDETSSLSHTCSQALEATPI